MLIKNYVDAPISRHLILSLLKDYKSPNDKISDLIKCGELISVRRGLYIPGPKLGLPSPEPILIANHLRGPSYVSLEAALSYWGLIPERTYEISSATTKTSKKYNTQVGRFTFYQLSLPYYSFGIKNIQLSSTQSVLMASAEKAICDKIVLTSKINLRSVKQTREFLMEDLRIDDEDLRKLDSKAIQSWLKDAPKRKSLEMLIKMLQEL